MRTLILTLIFVTLAGNLSAQCQNGRCQSKRPAATAYEWRQLTGDQDRDYLYRDGVQIGGWCYRECHWRDYDAASGKWGEPTDDPPIPVPGRESPPSTDPIPQPLPAREEEEVQFVAGQNNYGIDLDRMKLAQDGKHRYHLGGKEISQAEAFAAIDDGLPDDSSFMRMVLIGPKEQCDRVRTDVDGLLDWKGKLSIQDYRTADDPMIRGLGYYSGSPALFIADPVGRIYHAQSEYRPPQQLAEALQVADARRRDPKFDPKAVPDLNAKPVTPPSPLSPVAYQIPTWGWLVGGGVIAYVLFVMANRRKS